MAKTYKSKRGKAIDVQAVLSKHGDEIAAGNAQYNARGDLLGPNGEIIQRAADRARAYYKDNPKAVKRVSVKSVAADKIEREAVVVESESVPMEEDPVIENNKVKKTTKKNMTRKKATKKKAPDEIIKLNDSAK
jgi:hypothetical protein